MKTVELEEKTREQLLKKTNLIFALADIQESLSKDLESHAIRLNHYRFNVKQQIRDIQRVAGRFREMATNVLAKSGQEESFGVDCDYLKDKIFEVVEIE